jgi:hypothetical protein
VSDGSQILNLKRADNFFVDAKKRKKFDALSDENKIFCTQLLKRSCRYLDRTFPNGNTVGYENGKWNPLGWINACLAVAASDRLTGCWLVSEGLSNGRPVTASGGRK